MHGSSRQAQVHCLNLLPQPAISPAPGNARLTGWSMCEHGPRWKENQRRTDAAMVVGGGIILSMGGTLQDVCAWAVCV